MNATRPWEPMVIAIAEPADIFTAREEGRALAGGLGFSAWDQTMIASAISELARNILEFATGGWIALTPESSGDRVGLSIEARDQGPGIADPARALAGHGLSSVGFGLPGIHRLMDEFVIASAVGQGTTVTTKKWRTAAPLATGPDPAPAREPADAAPPRAIPLARG